MPPKPKQHAEDDNNPENVDFKSKLDLILSRLLTPQNIDSYAEEALQSLLGVTEQVIRLYKSKHGEKDTQRETEDFAYAEYGLGNIEEVLDHIIKLDNEINALDPVIENVNKTPAPKVIIPADIAKAIIVGSGNYEAPQTIARLKTILFVLKNDFDVDSKDSESLIITKGMLNSHMMRKDSYYSLELPKLGRTVLVCDEEGNVTFVLNNKELNQRQISHEELVRMTKEEIKDLIDSDTTFGQKIVFHENTFVDKVRAAISGELEGEATYLYPKPPEDSLSVTAMSKKWDLSWDIVKGAVEELKESLGEVFEYNFHNKVAPGYSLKQQDLIYAKLVESGIFEKDGLPEGYVSVADMQSEFGMLDRTLRLAIQRLGDSLGETKKFRFRRQVTVGYSPLQKEMIRNELFGKFAPEGYLSQTRITKMLGADPRTVSSVINELSEELGEVNSYKTPSGHMTHMYSPSQQETIKAGVLRRRLLNS